MTAKNRAKSAIDKAKGQTKQDLGKALKDRSLQAKGKGDEVKGVLREAGANLKDVFKS